MALTPAEQQEYANFHSAPQAQQNAAMFGGGPMPAAPSTMTPEQFLASPEGLALMGAAPQQQPPGFGADINPAAQPAAPQDAIAQIGGITVAQIASQNPNTTVEEIMQVGVGAQAMQNNPGMAQAAVAGQLPTPPTSNMNPPPGMSTGEAVSQQSTPGLMDLIGNAMNGGATNQQPPTAALGPEQMATMGNALNGNPVGDAMAQSGYVAPVQPTSGGGPTGPNLGPVNAPATPPTASGVAGALSMGMQESGLTAESPAEDGLDFIAEQTPSVHISTAFDSIQPGDTQDQVMEKLKSGANADAAANPGGFWDWVTDDNNLDTTGPIAGLIVGMAMAVANGESIGNVLAYGGIGASSAMTDLRAQRDKAAAEGLAEDQTAYERGVTADTTEYNQQQDILKQGNAETAQGIAQQNADSATTTANARTMSARAQVQQAKKTAGDTWKDFNTQQRANYAAASKSLNDQYQTANQNARPGQEVGTPPTDAEIKTLANSMTDKAEAQFDMGDTGTGEASPAFATVEAQYNGASDEDKAILAPQIEAAVAAGSLTQAEADQLLGK